MKIVPIISFTFKNLFMIIAGRIEDDQTGEGIAAVNMQIANAAGVPMSENVWQTDSDGYFAINEPVSVTPYLLISRAGYEKTLLSPDDFWQGKHIPLTRTGNLEEVVVTAKVNNWFPWLVVGSIAAKVLYDQTK
jgi:hypothetical protein